MGPARLPSYLVTNSILCLLDLMLSTVYISNSTSFAEVWIFLFWIFLPTHSPVSTGWRSRSIFSLRWRQSSIVHWTVRLLTTWLQICTVWYAVQTTSEIVTHWPARCPPVAVFYCWRPSYCCGWCSNMEQSATWHRRKWHTVTVSSWTQKKHFYLDSHILLFCFSSFLWSLWFLLRPR